jgi:exosortase A
MSAVREPLGDTVGSPYRVTQSAHVVLFLLAVTLVGWAYFGTYGSIAKKWVSDTAFSHGFLILPVSLWLVWRKRDALAKVFFEPSVLGVPAVLVCIAAWIIGRGSGILVLEQFAAVAMIPALVLAALGWEATRVLVVPLGFLIFLVPFGRGLVPLLMHATADFSTVLLQWSGVPVFRSYMHISIPSGNFEIARACSGLNYFITSLVLGALYAYLNFNGGLKRLICVAAFAVIPVILNGLRVYLTILVSHVTDMRFGPGAEHVTFGRIFFVAMMLAMFWIGRRWHDHEAMASTEHLVSNKIAASGSWLATWPLVLACLVAVAGPQLLKASIGRAQLRLSGAEGLVEFVPAASGWKGPVDAGESWRPLYHGGIVERQARYDDPRGYGVDVFVAVYGLGTSLGAEMISHGNIIYAAERGSLAQDMPRRVGLAGGSSLIVREILVPGQALNRLVWHWFVIGERAAGSEFAAKALEAAAFITGGADSERIVVISTPLDERAHERLEAFIQSHGKCVVMGFSGEVCRE